MGNLGLNNKTLKECPVCGRNDEVEVKNYTRYTYYVTCNRCKIKTQIFPSQEEAIEYWNKG